MNYMNDDFAPFELAVKLKKKGFPQRTFGEYDMQGACYIEDGLFYKNGCITEVARAYTAPTISQVLKWLREEKLILIGLSPMQEYGGDEVVEWCATAYKADKQGGLSWQEEFYYQSYEQAALAGINYVLDNLI